MRGAIGAFSQSLAPKAGQIKFTTIITRSLQADMQAELRDLERAIAAGTRSAGQSLKTELRRQVTSAGLGRRLAKSWRDKHYPNQQLDATSLVYTKAPKIIHAFDEGAVIRSRLRRFLTIATENAPRKGTDGRRISPSTFPEHRFGPLRFVPLATGLRDGDPGEPEQAVGGFGSTYYQHGVEIEVCVEEGDAAVRDAAFDDLLQQIGAALEADPSRHTR